MTVPDDCVHEPCDATADWKELTPAGRTSVTMTA